MRSTLSSLCLAIVAGLSSAGEADKKGPKFADAAWLAGSWHSPADARMVCEEHWSKPAAKTMMGMFRLFQKDKVSMYEYILLEEEDDGVWMSLRHFGPRMVNRDKEVIRLKLKEASDSRLVFENPTHDTPKRITYTLDAPHKLTATVETVHDTKTLKIVLPLERAKTDASK